MGQAFYLGKFGVTTNHAEAVTWFRNAAAQNFAPAQHNLGSCYLSGHGVATNPVEGVEKDLAEAMKWYRKAAEQDLAEAQFKLGLCLAFGRGATQDYVEAYAWNDLASKSDNSAPKVRADLEKRMSPLQIAAARKRADELRAGIEDRSADK